MKRIVTSVLIVMCSFKWSVAQEVSSNHFDNYPIVLTIQFQSFSLPFKNIKGHFRNIGIGIGTEVSHNGNHNWVQHFDFIWYRNSTMGNGIIISTQAGWRPFLRDPVYSELKFGIAYFHNFRPVESYKQNNTGEWVSIGKKGGGTWSFIEFGTSTHLK